MRNIRQAHKLVDWVRNVIWITSIPFQAIAAFILLGIFCFLPRKIVLCEWYARFWYFHFFKKLDFLYYRIFPTSTIKYWYKNIQGDYPLDQFPKHVENEDIVIRFSGGSDSTLVSAIMAERFKMVHLLTFRHAALRNFERSKIALGYLTKKFSSGKFIHKIISIDELRFQFDHKDYFRDFLKFGLYRGYTCVSCTLSQHIKAIAYCRKYGIRHVSDGTTFVIGRSVALSQMFSVLQELKKLYKEFGINFIINPSYNLERSDHELYERHITEIENIKWTQHHYETQGECYLGRFLIRCALSYYFVLYGKECISKTAPRYFKYKYALCKQLIEHSVASRDI